MRSLCSLRLGFLATKNAEITKKDNSENFYALFVLFAVRLSHHKKRRDHKKDFKKTSLCSLCSLRLGFRHKERRDHKDRQFKKILCALCALYG